MKRDASSAEAGPLKLVFHPLTPKRWPDLVSLFGERGACGGCWCMFWRLPRSQFQRQKGAANKRALKKLTEKGVVSGLIAYLGDLPIGWRALRPRQGSPTLARSRA